MDALLRTRLEMAVRVRDFLRAHKTDGVGDVEALTRFEELVSRAEKLVAQQEAGMTAVRSATLQRAEIRRVLETKLLRYLKAAGKVAARDNVELAVQFKLPRKVSHQVFLTVARRMLDKAGTIKDQLVKEGMSASLIDDLTSALAQFEGSLDASRTGRREHVGASADLAAIGGEIVERVRVLDGLVGYRFGDNPELMGAWASARNVFGPTKSKGQPAEGETPAAEGPQSVKPAA